MIAEECEVCFTTTPEDWQFLPCSHKLCSKCFSKLILPKTCPWCRAPVGVGIIIDRPIVVTPVSLRDTLDSPEAVIRYERQAQARLQRRHNARINKRIKRNKPRSNSI